MGIWAVDMYEEVIKACAKTGDSNYTLVIDEENELNGRNPYGRLFS
jgi:hypothetical protein